VFFREIISAFGEVGVEWRVGEENLMGNMNTS
jgi:hypothetical protein